MGFSKYMKDEIGTLLNHFFKFTTEFCKLFPKINQKKGK